jgi:G3E family GTPase
MTGGNRTELVLVAGGTTPVAAREAERLIERLRALRPGTAVLHHDLRDAGHGVLHRRLRHGGTDRTVPVDLHHGCVSCTLREDTLPLLRRLGRDPDVQRIVLHLDPVLEPEQICWALLHVPVDGAPVTDTVDLRGVIGVLDVDHWLDDATGADDLAHVAAERGLAELPGDDRTMAQLAVAHAELADLLVLAGETEPWQRVRTGAVLTRLNPLARHAPLRTLDPEALMLARLSDGARRGRPDSMHATLLRGQPPLDPDGPVELVVSPPVGPSTPSGCTPRSTSCSAGWCAPAAGSGWPTGPRSACGWSRPAAACASATPGSGCPPTPTRGPGRTRNRSGRQPPPCAGTRAGATAPRNSPCWSPGPTRTPSAPRSDRRC